MDRSFIIPIAVAAGVHSLLFLSSTPTQPPTKPPPKIETVLREYVLPPLDLDIADIEPTGEKVATKPPPPSTPDIPTINFDPNVITREIDHRDMIPRPGAPDTSEISSDWQNAVHSGVAPTTGLFSPIDLDNPPAARFQPAPLYPRELRTLGSDGTATVTFSVDVNGHVFEATVSNATHSSFGEEALRAVRRWRFEPGLKDGKRVAFRMVQTFTFALAQ